MVLNRGVGTDEQLMSWFCLQSDPEFVQWKKELTEAFQEAQKLLRRAPKVIGKGRAGVVELSKPPLTHRNSNGL